MNPGGMTNAEMFDDMDLTMELYSVTTERCKNEWNSCYRYSV